MIDTDSTTNRLTRRAALAIAAGTAINATAIAIAKGQTDPLPSNPDSALLALGPELDAIEHEWIAQHALDEAHRAVFEAKMKLATGIAFEDAPEMVEGWEDDKDGYWAIRDRISKENFRNDPEESPWDAILDRMWPLVDDILARKAHTIAGLTMQVRALRMATCNFEDMEQDSAERQFAEAVCAFVGITRQQFH
jgi:hypothetical protein